MTSAHPKARAGTRGDAALVWAEFALGVLAVLWLLLVGVLTQTVLHHALHAMPLVLVMLLRRNVWVRTTRVLAGFVWIVMLCMISSMIHHVLHEGITRSVHFTWLAPGLVLISITWASANIAILSGSARTGAFACTILLGIAVAGAHAHPFIGGVYGIPLEHILEGRISWLFALLGLLLPTVGLPLLGVYLLIERPKPKIGVSVILYQAAFWVFFVVCMIAGISVTHA